MSEYIEREAIERALTAIYSGLDGYKTRCVFYNAIELVQNFQNSDVTPVRLELRKAVKVLHTQYEMAINNPVVRNPLAWALYHTWKQMDGD